MAAGIRNGPLVRRLVRGHRLTITGIKTWTTEVGNPTSTASRCAALAAAGYVIVTMVGNGRGILWILCAGWALTAFRKGLRAERQDAADRELAQLIRDLIGDSNGVHLARVVTALNTPAPGAKKTAEDPQKEAWDFPALRTALERMKVPVRESVKVGGEVSPGINAQDLNTVWPLHPTPPPAGANPSRDGKSAGNYPTTPTVTTSANGAQITVQPGAETPLRPGGEPDGECPDTCDCQDCWPLPTAVDAHREVTTS
jgi:hypothetical protein